jgi:hypothetical protein
MSPLQIPTARTFVYSSREERLNNAVALKAYLEEDDGGE